MAIWWDISNQLHYISFNHSITYFFTLFLIKTFYIVNLGIMSIE